ncbi:MAG: ABC transporter ATP-binding protein [Lachnospiraceae bacterium]|nr:ABC transporter ATP-binding protein [Lachnospiraceae bacterium]
MIKVENLSKIYDDVTVVDNLSFHLEKGKVYGFLGPNGAGKSTTMNMLTGYLAPTKGTISMKGIDLLKAPDKAKANIGYLPEIPPLYPDMTVTEYLMFAAEIKGILTKAFQKEAVDKVMEQMMLTPVARRMIKNLSKGYKQRVGFAMALLGRPDILILDEPTVGLDPKQIVEIRNLIKKLKDGRTIILSSHILSEINAVCDRLLILSRGKLVADATAEELVAKYNRRQILEIVLKGNATGAENMLKRMKEIESYRFLSEDAQSCKISVTVKEGMDIREKISSGCVKEGYVLLELKVTRVTLEDVYLMLTKEAQ